MDASASLRLTEAIRNRDLSLVINTPEEADFWDAMIDMDLMHLFFDFSKKLTLEEVLARERAKALITKKASPAAQ